MNIQDAIAQLAENKQLLRPSVARQDDLTNLVLFNLSSALQNIARELEETSRRLSAISDKLGIKH